MRQRLLDLWWECTGSALLGQDHSLSCFSQPLGRGGRGPRLAVYRTVRAGNEEKGLALTPPGAQRQPATLSRACAQQLVQTVGCERGITTLIHSPANEVKRGQPACEPQHPVLSTPKKPLPKELSLRDPHIATERIRLFPVPPVKDPQQKGSEIYSRTVRSQPKHGCINRC